MARILSFDRGTGAERRQSVGRLHPDGSITFRGRKYRSLKEVPPQCRGLHLDVSGHCQWRAIWRQIDPQRKRQRLAGFRRRPPEITN